MLQLHHGSSRSTPSVFPKNWKTGGSAILKLDWRIQYYFREPEYPAGRRIVVKGKNAYKTLEQRRAVTAGLLENELKVLTATVASLL